jgi:hypothetical protein
MPRDQLSTQAMYLFLLHEFGVGAVVDHVAPKDRGGEWRVDFLGANVAELAIQNEVVALGAQVDRGLLAKEDEGENVAVLRISLLETPREIFQGGRGRRLRTFARALKKNL